MSSLNTAHPLVTTMISAAQKSCAAFRARISEVRTIGLSPCKRYEMIGFLFDGKPATGLLKGRNASLCVGLGNEEVDKGIALVVILDGDSNIQFEFKDQ